VAVEEPIHLIFVASADLQPVVSHPRNLVALGRGSRATVLETYVGLDGNPYFTNAVTEVVLAESSRLDHYKLQQEHDKAYHMAATHVRQQQGSRFSSHYLSIGGSLVRNEINIVLDAAGAQCTLHGLYMPGGRQHMDSRTRIDHAKPSCKSFELYKGILNHHARGVFNGKIYVHPDAQKTDARQNNQVLLLSDEAAIDTKPQLEIYADDVRCTHGATVGQLDEQAMYYLRSRGIPADMARSLLLYAFANEIVRDVSVDSLRSRLERMLLADHGLPLL
jgi:Fe-S cluster assembly protein SufD